MTAVLYGGLQDGSGFVEKLRELGIRTIIWITPDSENIYRNRLEETVNNVDCVIVKSADDSSFCRKLLDEALARRVPVFREECVDSIPCKLSFCC